MQYLKLKKKFLFAHTDKNTLKANVAVVCPTVMVHSRKFPGLSYDPKMEYPDRKRSYFSSVPQNKRRHSTLN